MKLSEPIGNPNYAPLFIRIALGIYFVLAGLAKFEHLQQFIAEVQSFELAPEHVSTLFAILLPYVEVAAGGLLVLGMWTTLAAVVTTFLLACFVYAFGLFPTRPDLFNKDIILLAASLSVLYSGAGAISVDGFRKAA